MSAPAAPRLRGRGSAPPWRQALLALGLDDPRPERDAVHSERLAGQVRKRTPDQLRQAVGALEACLPAFDRAVGLAQAYRARGLTPHGAHALLLNELWRFASVARALAQASADRPNHALDERLNAQQLREAARNLGAELERAVPRSLIDDLGRRAGGWTEPAPGLIAARRQRRLAAGAFAVLLVALTAGLAWLLLNP